MTEYTKNHVSIVGAGFTGLSAAYELARKGVKVTVLESEGEVGGLAAAFDVEGEKLDRFYQDSRCAFSAHANLQHDLCIGASKPNLNGFVSP